MDKMRKGYKGNFGCMEFLCFHPTLLTQIKPDCKKLSAQSAFLPLPFKDLVDHSLVDIYKSIVPFVLLMCIGLALIMIFPQIAVWLPEFYYGN